MVILEIGSKDRLDNVKATVVSLSGDPRNRDPRLVLPVCPERSRGTKAVPSERKGPPGEEEVNSKSFSN